MYCSRNDIYRVIEVFWNSIEPELKEREQTMLTEYEKLERKYKRLQELHSRTTSEKNRYKAKLQVYAQKINVQNLQSTGDYQDIELLQIENRRLREQCQKQKKTIEDKDRTIWRLRKGVKC